MKGKELLGNESTRYNLLLQLAKEQYNNSNIKSHDWKHIQRVLGYCKKLSEKTKAVDTAILFSACILHDLGRSSINAGHSTETNLGTTLLRKAGYKENEISRIIACIKQHSVDSGENPSSLEAKILFDADKLDSYGFIGVARFFMLAGEQNQSLKEAADNAFQRVVKLSKISGFYTKEAEEIGIRNARRTFVFYYLMFNELGMIEKARELEKIFIKKFGKFKGRIYLKFLKNYF